jgi:pimeloyl-ACP methyl ester carboxylesterase
MVFEGEDAAAILPLSPAATLDFSRVTLPIRILTGTLDRIVDHERHGKALARLLPNAALTEVEGAGHMLHHSHPDVVIKAIAELNPSP